MKRHAKQIVLWTAFLLFPMSANAQITDYTGDLGNREYLNFVNAGNAEVSTWSHDGSRVYVGPYVGQFGTTATDARFSLICVDFENYAGDQWVDVTNLGSATTSADLSQTRLGQHSDAALRAGSLSTYRSAAFLGSLFDSWETLGSDRRTVFSAIHSAIWSLTTPDNIGGTGTTAYQDLRYALLDRAMGAEGLSFGADGWYVLSSAAEGGRGYQEMLIRTPASTVPEPSTYLLMATGLLFLAFFGRKRMRELDQA